MAIQIHGTIKPKNNGSFPVAEAADILMPDGSRLDSFSGTAGTALATISNRITTLEQNQSAGGVSSWEDLTDKPFTYTEGEGTDLLPEQTLQFADMDDGSGMYNTVVQSAGRLLTAGETYAVIWDGVEYTFVCQTVSIGDEATEFIGNTALIGGEETADPMGIAQFVVALEDGTVVYIVTMVTPDTSESHTVALRTGGGGRWVLNESALPMSAIDARIEEVISAALEGDY